MLHLGFKSKSSDLAEWVLLFVCLFVWVLLQFYFLWFLPVQMKKYAGSPGQCEKRNFMGRVGASYFAFCVDSMHKKHDTYC